MATDDRIDIVVTDKVDTAPAKKLTELAREARASHKALVDLQQQIARGNNVYLQQEAALNRAIAAEQKASAASNQNAVAQQQLAAATARTSIAENQAALSSAKLAAANQQAAAAAQNAAAAQVRAAAAAEAAQQRVAAAVARTATEQARAAAATQVAAAAQTRATTAVFQADAAYQRLQASAIRTTSAQTQANTAKTVGATAAQRLAAATAQAEAAQSRAAAAALRLEQAQQRAANAGAGGSGLVGSLLKVGVAAVGISSAMDLVKAKFEETQQYTNLQNKLRNVVSAQEDVQRLTNQMLEAANRARSPLEAFGTTFQRINSAIVQVGGTQKEAISITEALTKTIAASGKSVSEQESALLQVSQAFNKGKLDGDEFRTVMEVLPEFADKLTKALGLANRAALFEASKNGKINLDAMRDAMRLMGEEADKKLSNSVLTADQAFTKLKNSSIVLTGRIDEALGISRTFTSVLNALAEAAERSAKAQNGISPTEQLASQSQIVAKLDEQIAAKKALIAAGQAGVAGEQALLRLEQTRANVVKSMAEAREKESTQQSEDILTRKAAERQAINAKEAAAAAEAAKVKEKEDKAQEKRDASRAREFESELQRLRERTAELGAQTEYEKAIADIEAGRWKGLLNASKAATILEAALAKDLDKNRNKIDGQAAEDQRALLANRERQAQAIEDENRALESQITALAASESAQVALTNAKLDDLIASKEFQRDLLLSITGITEQTKAFDAQANALRRQKQLKQELRDQQFLQQNLGQNGLFSGTAESQQKEVEAYQEANAAIDRLLEKRTISEQTAATARLRINIQAQQSQLQFADQFFGSLAQLQDSKSKTMSRIGKAAAIAQTTIDTYRAATAAYASLAGIPYVGPALGVAAAAAAVAAGMANVQRIRSSPGFQMGGYTGDYGIAQPVGTVHGREFVVNANGTRDNREALETLNRTGSLPTGDAPRVVVNNYGTPQQYQVQSLTRDEVVLIARDVADNRINERAPSVVANNLSMSNSVMDKSMRANVDAQRKR